jgi:hypothetical protein
VLVESPSRFTGAVEAGDDHPVHVHHLALDVDP